MIDFYVKLVQNDVIPQVEYYERINIENGTYAGTVAWVSDAVNYCGSAIKNGYEITVADYTALSPQKSGEGWEAKPASLYAISNNTDHPTESAMLLDFPPEQSGNGTPSRSRKGSSFKYLCKNVPRKRGYAERNTVRGIS